MLLGLARVYGTTVSELLGEEPPERDPVIRAARAEPVEADGWIYRQAGSSSGRAMQPLRVTVPYGAQGDLVRVHPGRSGSMSFRGGSGSASATPSMCSTRATAPTSTR